MKALLSIKPEFVEEIIEGRKKFEYRKKLFKRSDISSIVVYATKPYGKVVGEFEIETILEENIDKLKDYDFCAVNLSVNTELFFILKPKMLVMVDMIFWKQPELDKIKKAWNNIQRINWDIQVFLPYDFPNSMKNTFEKNKYVKVCRYANNCWDPETHRAKQLKMWLYKKGLVSPNGTNVSIAAIYTSILNGYKEINLLGVEHSWMRDIKVNEKNEVILIDRHYYGDTEHILSLIHI